MTTTAAFEMAVVHRAFRDGLHDLPDLINDVAAGDVKRAAVVNAHLKFLTTLLHHHHAAEDELVWPQLHARVSMRDNDIHRMEDAHRAIADGIEEAIAAGAVWAKSGALSAAERLRAAVDALIGVVDVHLADEEREIIPLIDEYLTPPEWKKATARGASILRTHPKLGLVFAGYMFDGLPDEDKRRFLASVPAAARLMWKLRGPRTYEGYRSRLCSSAR